MIITPAPSHALGATSADDYRRQRETLLLYRPTQTFAQCVVAKRHHQRRKTFRPQFIQSLVAAEHRRAEHMRGRRMRVDLADYLSTTGPNRFDHHLRVPTSANHHNTTRRGHDHVATCAVKSNRENFAGGSRSRSRFTDVTAARACRPRKLLTVQVDSS